MSRSPIESDALLADFTDRLLDGKLDGVDTSADEELRGLEDVVLRLRRSFPQEVLDAKRRRQMEIEFQARARKEGPAPARTTWRSRQWQQRLVLALAVIIVLAIIVATPLLSSGTGNVQGTAGLQTQGIAVLFVLGGVIVLLIWLGRRK